MRKKKPLFKAKTEAEYVFPRYLTKRDLQGFEEILGKSLDPALKKRLAMAVRIYRSLDKIERSWPKHKQKEKVLEEVIGGTERFLELVNKHESIFVDLLEDIDRFVSFEETIAICLILGIERKKKIPKDKPGRPQGHALRSYCRELIDVYETATGKRVTTKYDPYYDGAYGPDLDFIMWGLGVVGVHYSQEGARSLIRATLRDIRAGRFAPTPKNRPKNVG